jgi:hypothetical protein
MPGFDHLDTAAALREIIGSVAEQRIQEITPSSSYGRVISVNTVSLTATVWFPGDDSPVSVNMFPNLVPGAWHEKYGQGSGSGITNTSYYGYGSQVAVADFNGKKYITQVLTDSVLWPEARIMSPTIVAQVATEVAADLAGNPAQLVGEPAETFINCSISSLTLTDGQAISFGPFVTKNDSLPGVGWIEMSVVELNGAVKYFNFTVNPPQDFQHTGGNSFLDDWFRVIPSRQICNPNSSQIVDFELDIAIKRTVYGLKDDFTPSEELWFRIVKRGNGWTGFSGQVSIRATNIQKGRSLSGRKLFMQETNASPPSHKGFVGFHNAQHIYRDIDDYGIVDAFGRTVASNGSSGVGWDISDSGPNWTPKTGGPFGVDGLAGYIAPTGNYVSYMTLNKASVENPDVYWDMWISAVPTGAEVQTAMIARWTDINNMILCKVVFNTAATITLSIVQIVSGTATVIGTDYNPGITFTANQKLRCRARVFGTAMFIKCWNLATSREPDWVKTEGGAPFGTPNAAHQMGFMVQPGAANSNTKPISVYFDNIRASLYVKGQDNTGRQWHTGPWRSGLLRVADSVQKTMIWDQSPTWDGTKLLWSNYLRFGGIGQHRYGLAAADAQLQLPSTAASGFSIPVVPNGTARTVGSDGVQLNAGEALYVAVPPGQTWENMYEYLFIVDNTAAVDYDLPEWAVLIAMRTVRGGSTVGPQIRLGNGQYLDNWKAVTYSTPNLSDFGAGWETVAWRWDVPGVIRFKGLLKHTTTNYTGAIFAAPVLPGTAGDQMWSVVSANSFGTPGTSRVDLQSSSSGNFTISSHGTNGGTQYLSLSGITYNTSNV